MPSPASTNYGSPKRSHYYYFSYDLQQIRALLSSVSHCASCSAQFTDFVGTAIWRALDSYAGLSNDFTRYSACYFYSYLGSLESFLLALRLMGPGEKESSSQGKSCFFDPLE